MANSRRLRADEDRACVGRGVGAFDQRAAGDVHEGAVAHHRVEPRAAGAAVRVRSGLLLDRRSAALAAAAGADAELVPLDAAERRDGGAAGPSGGRSIGGSPASPQASAAGEAGTDAAIALPTHGCARRRSAAHADQRQPLLLAQDRARRARARPSPWSRRPARRRRSRSSPRPSPRPWRRAPRRGPWPRRGSSAPACR